MSNYAYKGKKKDFLDKLADRIVVLYVAFAVIPILTLFNNSFRILFEGFLFTVGNLLRGFGSFFGFMHYIGFTGYIKNSLLLCALSIVLGLSLAIPTAYALSRYKFRGVNLFGILVVIPLLIPSITYFLSFAVSMKSFEQLTNIDIYNSYNGYIVLALMYSVMYLPYCIWILRGSIVAIPIEIEEAARVDGCSNFKLITKIILPLIRSGIVVASMFIVMLVWDERFLVDVLMTENQYRTVALLPSYEGFRFISGPISTVPIFVIFFLIQKKFMKGITGGALKQ